MNSDERETQLKQIRERQRNRATSNWDSHGRSMIKDIHFLLSLIDSQAADSDDERLEAMLKKSGILHTCHRPHDSGTALERLARNVSDLAATSMRDLCVEKVREVLKPYELEFRQKTGGRFATNMVDYTAMALESLTLDQVQEKQ